MSQRTISILWVITGLAALIMLIATLHLTIKTRNAARVEVTAYISGSKPSVYMRQSPSEHSKIVTILKVGTRISIKNASTENEIDWYYVSYEDQSGWIPVDQISLNPP
jgi:SH3-like domain-containing protein